MNTRRQRGAQAVEFALALPFFLVLMLLTIDFGFLVINKAVITNASREAARAGTVVTLVPWSVADVALVACKYARNSLLSTNPVTITSDCSGANEPGIAVSNPNGNVPPHFGDPVTVTVTYPYRGFLTIFQGIIIEPAWSLQAVSTMNHE